jgi:hypothetical protein
LVEWDAGEPLAWAARRAAKRRTMMRTPAWSAGTVSERDDGDDCMQGSRGAGRSRWSVPELQMKIRGSISRACSVVGAGQCRTRRSPAVARRRRWRRASQTCWRLRVSARGYSGACMRALGRHSPGTRRRVPDRRRARSQARCQDRPLEETRR